MPPDITTLIEILTGKETPSARRIEAAGLLLEYAAPVEIMAKAQQILTEIFQSKGEELVFRLDALKLSRKVSAAKINRPTTAAADDPANRERWRRIEMAQRRMALLDSDLWPAPPGWADDLSGPGYQPPERAGASGPDDFTGLAKRMKATRKRQQR